MKADQHRAAISTRLVGLVMTLLLLAALTPSSYAQNDQCDMLKDGFLKVMLGSGLERKLMILCGAVSTEAGAAQPNFLAPVQPSLAPEPSQGEAILISDPTQDSEDTGWGTTQSETTIVIDRGTVCAAWNDSGQFDLDQGLSGFGSGKRRGRNWTDYGSFPNGPGDTNFGDPSLAVSKRDKAIYYAALSSRGLSLWKSTDNCRTFDYVGPIHDESGFGDDKELMAVDNNRKSPFFGRIYVGWTNFGRFPNPGDLNQTTFSDDGGLTWSMPETLPGSGTAGQGMWPAVAPNGDVYFALLNRSFDIGGLQDQWIYKSTNGGASWTQMMDIAAGQLRPENIISSVACGRQALNGDIRNLSSPQIAIHRDKNALAGYVIHAVYPYDSDGAGPDESDVFYKRSFDGASTWSTETKLNDDSTPTDQWFPALGVNNEGVVVVSWYDRRFDPGNNLSFDRFAVVSKDGGLTWGPNLRVSDIISPVANINPNFDILSRCYHGDYDQLVVEGKRAHIIWSGDQRITATGPNPDIYELSFSH